MMRVRTGAVGRWTLMTYIAVFALALATAAAAQDKPVEIAVTIENNRFSPAEIKVPAGKPFVLVVTNKDGKPEEFESKELRIEKVIPAGKTVRIKLPALKAGTYGFFGEFHEKTARGKIIAE
jgi:plastocyanin